MAYIFGIIEFGRMPASWLELFSSMDNRKGAGMQSLTPLTLKERYYARIEALIRRTLENVLYSPLMQIVGMQKKQLASELKNSRSALREAMAAGRIWYEDGQFKGKFNSKTSAEIIKLGGVYNVKSATYSLPRDRVPIDMRLAQAAAQDRYEKMRVAMLGILNDIDLGNEALGELKEEYQKTLEDMDEDLKATLPRGPFQRVDNPATHAIAIEAVLTEDQKRIISNEWAENLNLYIKNWTDDAIIKLRSDIQPIVLAGGRAESLEKSIMDSYGVTARKAAFLARQETSLLMSKFKETRYRDIGIEEYTWSDSHDQRVRHDHHELNGKTFRYDSPPVTNKKTGARNNPGCDFGCRCIDIPKLPN